MTFWTSVLKGKENSKSLSVLKVPKMMSVIVWNEKSGKCQMK